MTIETKDIKVTVTIEELLKIEKNDQLATFIQLIGSIGLNMETVDMLSELEDLCHVNEIYSKENEPNNRSLTQVGFLYEVLLNTSWI